jgi:hypothetical protein
MGWLRALLGAMAWVGVGAMGWLRAAVGAAT